MLVQIAIIRDDRLGSNFFILKISVSFLWDENSTNSNEDVCIEHLEQLEKAENRIYSSFNCDRTELR